MTLGVVTRDPFATFEMKLLAKAAKAQGIRLVRFDPLDWGFDAAGREALINGSPLRPDGVIGRVDADCLNSGIRLLTLFEEVGVPTFNGALSFTIGRDKSLMSARLWRKRLPHPWTCVLSAGERRRQATRLPYPVVVKPLNGYGGRGVRSFNSAPAFLKGTEKEQEPLCVQARVLKIKGEFRVIVVGGKALGALRRTPINGEWRANLSLGARGERAVLNRPLARLAVAAAEALNADFAGVDIVDTEYGPVVLEVNVCPAFLGFAKHVRIDPAHHLITYIHKRIGKLTLPKRSVNS